MTQQLGLLENVSEIETPKALSQCSSRSYCSLIHLLLMIHLLRLDGRSALHFIWTGTGPGTKRSATDSESLFIIPLVTLKEAKSTLLNMPIMTEILINTLL